jgi:hypothetical protein
MSLAARKEPEKKRFDSRNIPTFLQKTYSLVDVFPISSRTKSSRTSWNGVLIRIAL